MKRKAKRLLSLILSVYLLLTLLPASALAEAGTPVDFTYSDTANHWAAPQIEKWSKLGILKGYEGKFRPNAPITRGEMAVVIDRIMRYQTSAENTFSDLGQAFYTDAVLKANAAGIMSGYDGRVRPTDNITREEAVTMLGRALGIAESETGTAFSDADSISAYARGFVNALSARGFIAGYDGKFKPKSPITRAEVVKILDNAVAGLYSAPGEYSQDSSGVVIVSVPDVTLKDMTITGDLIIAQGVGSGDVILDNVTVTGNTIIRGGGADSIHITGNSSLANISIEKTDEGQVRVVTSDGVEISALVIEDGKDGVILDGSFNIVTLNAEINVIITENTVVGTLTVNSTAKVTNNGTVKTAIVNADGIVISGNKPQTITISSDVTVAPVVENGSPLKQETVSPGGGGYAPTYTITFETNGGNPISPVSLSKGTSLNTLPVPVKIGAMFDGWFYDSEFNSRVQSTDTLTSSLTLYAKFTEAGALVQRDTPRYASALNQDPDFSIVVLADGKSLEEVKAGITAENLFAPDQTDIINVTGSGGSFTVSGKNGTFNEGASYRLTLTDDALRFNGYADTVRTFTFSIARQEVMTLGLSDRLRYLPAGDISGLTQNGNRASTLSMPLVTMGSESTNFNSSEGTFEYDGVPGFEVGDIVAIYEGVLPSERNINDASGKGDVAYVEITAVSGTTYSYKTANAKDVLFTPDVLPVNVYDDEDSEPYTITIDKDKMFFGDDKYAELNLNAATTVDVGDFICFYTGIFGAEDMDSEGYGQTTAVADDGNDNYVITFISVDLEDILNAASLYDTEVLDPEELLANTDIDALEDSIEKQAIESGFAERAAQYLTALTLQTDSFTKLNEEMVLESFSITAEDGTPMSRSEIRSLAVQEPTLSDLSVNVYIGYNLPHFNYIPGTSCNVTVSFKLTLGNDEKAVVIRVTGSFTEEVKIETSLSVDIKWKWYFIFPVPVDFVAEAGFEFYTYTGIGINASIYTEDQPNGMNIGSELEKLLNSVDNAYNKEVKDSLIEKYQQMLQNDSDWVELFSKEICKTEGSIDPFHIVAYSIKLEFKVSANVNVSLGCTFSHKSAKGYYYSISLANKTATSRQADLVEERQEFTFYVLGTIGLRAGVELTLELGLFSVELDSIGISAEVGVYVQLWGYFYYRYSYSTSAGSDEKYAGALYIELGIYLEINFFAQALNEKYKFEYDIYSNEWPLWSAGSEESVLDFVCDESEIPVLALFGTQQSIKVDNKLFTMSQINLKSGEDSEVLYDDASDFTIEITNDAFKYDTSTNKLSVMPTEGVSKLTGEMIITWKNAPLVFTSSPISRTIPLYWDTPVGSVAVVPYDIAPTEDTEPSYMYSVINGETFDLPDDLRNPTWWPHEYLFDGWYTDAAFTQPQAVPFVMPHGVESITIYAKWIPNPNFPYHVDYYLMNTDGVTYSLYDADIHYGTARTVVDLLPPDAEKYPGFTLNPGYPTKLFITRESGEYSLGIPNGVAAFYYTRNSHIVTFHMLPDGSADIEIRVYYGGAIPQPNYVRPGYDFDGWCDSEGNDIEMPAVMPDEEGLEFTAKWKPRTDTTFRVEHYVEKPVSSGKYVFISLEKRTGTTDTTLTAEVYKLSDDSIYIYDHATVNGTQIQDATLSGDGSLVIKLYYTYDISKTANYTVRHVRESVDGSYSEAGGAVVFEEVKAGRMGELTEAAVRSYGLYRYFTPKTLTQKTIEPDGSTVVTIQYERKTYTVTWDATEGYFTDGSKTITQTVKYGAAIVRPEKPTCDSMTFTGWGAEMDLSDAVTTDSLLMLPLRGDEEGIIYEATWDTPDEDNTITVSLYSDPAIEPEVRQLTVGQPYGELPEPVQPEGHEGYTFAGWYTRIADKPITSETIVSIAADHELYAYWIPNKYEIDYYLYTYEMGPGGTNHTDNPDSYEPYTLVTLKAPSREGYTFLYWVDFYGNKVEDDEAIPVGTKGRVSFEAIWD